MSTRAAAAVEAEAPAAAGSGVTGLLPPGSLFHRIAEILAEEARERRAVANGVEDALSLCKNALAKLREAASALLQEPGEAADTIYEDLVEAVPSTLDQPIIEPAARLVNALFNGPAPLAGAISVAGDIVSETFLPADGGPLPAALRDLAHLMRVPYSNAGHLFTAYAEHLGFLPSLRTWPHWLSSHVLAGAQARVAMDSLAVAVGETIAAEAALRLCQGELEPEERLPWDRMAAAQLRLERAINSLNQVRVMLQAMQHTLVDLKLIAKNAPGQLPRRARRRRNPEDEA